MTVIYANDGVKRINVRLRPNTCDELVFREVWAEDVYRMGCFPPPKPGQHAIDLGANVGAWTLAALACGVDGVYAVEPFPDNMGALAFNIDAAGERDRVRFVQAAVVGSCERRDLWLVGGSDDYPSITYQAHDTVLPGDREAVAVQAVCLNDLLDQRESWWMLKCDIEGGEYDVFRGVDAEMLNRVDYLAMEFHGRGMGQHVDWIADGSFGELVARLSEWGHVQTLGAASRGGQLYGWRYGVDNMHEVSRGWGAR